VNLQQRLAIYELLSRRKSQGIIDPHRLRAPGFDVQSNILNDRYKHRFRALNATRRAAKSYTNAIDDFEIAEKYPGSRIVTAGLTLGSIMAIIWDVYHELDDAHKMGLKFNKSSIMGPTISFPNKSKIVLAGIDASERQIRRTLGQKLRKFSADEAGSMNVDLRKVCYQMVMPALADLRPFSWLTLLGTCENIPRTFFEKVTSGDENYVKWSVHRWTAYENPFMQKQWTEEMNSLIRNNPAVVEASWFKTHYLNVWCSDDELLIVPVDDKVFVSELPNDLNYVLGVDLGYNDACAFSVLAYNYAMSKRYVVKAYKESGLDITDTANEIRKISQQFPLTKIVVDGSNKQGIEEMKKRHALPLTIAEKTGKATYLRLLKDDIKTGCLKLLEGETNELYTEWESLQWKDDTKEKEDDRCQNHLSDATLYAWRECRNYFPDEQEPANQNSQDYMDFMAQKEADELEQELRELRELQDDEEFI
jgi:hypothetical protein